MNSRICSQYTQPEKNSNMKKTSIVVVITVLTMAVEIVYGILTGSMALLADGIHMGTHGFALIVAVIAYYVTGKNIDNPNFSFSSGKINVLGGYTNAIVLGFTAFYMVFEAVKRLIDPEAIHFDQALLVAVVGLVVNIVSAAILSTGSDHHHHHDHHQDHNLRAAYIHVITDAMTSVLAIAALLIAKFFNQTWPDALVAILGAVVILKWGYGLLVSSGSLLVDYYPVEEDLNKIEAIAYDAQVTIEDLHVWKSSENCKVIIVELKAGKAFEKKAFSEQVKSLCHCDHLTVEITA